MEDDQMFSDAPQMPPMPMPGEPLDGGPMPGGMGKMGGMPMQEEPEEMEEEEMEEEKKLPLKSSKPGMNPQIKCVNCLNSAIRSINQYIETLADSDPVNAKAARNIIAILGELLKTAQLDETQANPKMPEILS